MRSCSSLFALALCLGCSKDEQPRQGAAPADETSAAKAVGSPAAGDAARPWVGTPAIGHFRVASLETLVDKARRQLVPEAVATMATTETLLELIDAQDDRELAKAVDTSKAAACVFATTPTEPPETDGACALVIEGGGKAVLPAFGEPYVAAASGSHIAHFVRPPDPEDEDDAGPLHVYVDDFDGYVILSSDDRSFKALAPVAVAVAGRPGRDIELVLYPDQIIEHIAPIVREEMKAAVEGRTDPAALRKKLSDDIGSAFEGMPGFHAADAAPLSDSLAELDEATPEDAEKLVPLVEAFLDLGSQIHEVGMGMNLEPAGLVLSAWYRAADNSSAQRVLRSGPNLDLASFANVPRSSALIRGSVPTPYSPFADVDPKLLEEIGLAKGLTTRLLSIVVEALTEGASDPALAKDLEGFVAEQAALFRGGSTWAVFGDGKGGPAGLMLEFPLVDGASATTSWAQAAERFPATRVLGAEAAREFTWSLESNAAALGDTQVDRWRFRSPPTPPTPPSEGTVSLDFAETFADGFDVNFDVDTFERGGAVTLLVTREGEPALSLLAHDAPSSPAGLDAALARGDHVVSLWALDVRALREFLLTFDQPDAATRAMLEQDLGGDFGDVYGVTHLSEHGGTMELVISQQLLNQIRAQ